MATVLIVDDTRTIRSYLSTMLRMEGHNVVEAEDGVDALNVLKYSKPDLILLDIMMPGMSGWDVFNRIKKKNNNIKVAFMSVLEISDKRKQVLLDEGLADYIMKPFDKETLLNRVDKILTD